MAQPALLSTARAVGSLAKMALAIPTSFLVNRLGILMNWHKDFFQTSQLNINSNCCEGPSDKQSVGFHVSVSRF